MSGVLAAVAARLRFAGAAASGRGRFCRGKSVPVVAEFYDPFTGRPATPAGVSWSAFRPDGTELDLGAGEGTGATRGVLVPATQVGEWVVVLYATAPSDEVARIVFDVEPAEPGIADDLQPAWVTPDDVLIFPSGAPVTAERIDRLPDLGPVLAGDRLPVVRAGVAGRVDADIIFTAAEDAAATVAAAEKVRRLIAPGVLLEDGAALQREEGGAVLLEGTLPLEEQPTFEQAFIALPAAAAALDGTEPVAALVAGEATRVTADAIAARAVASGAAAPALHFHTDDNFREHYSRVFGTLGPDDDGNVPVVTLNNAAPRYALSGANVGGIVRVANAGGFVRCDTLPLSKGFTEIDVQTGADCLLWAGPASGVNWRNTGGKMLLAASGSVVRVRRGQNDCVAELCFGSALSASVASPPVPASIRISVTQSWGSDVRGIRHWLWGMQDVRRLLVAAGLEPGLDRYVMNLFGTAFGASSVCKGGATIPTNYWRDQDTGAAGPNLTASIAAALAGLAAVPGAPAPEAMIVQFGANDFPVFSSAGPVTVAGLRANYAGMLGDYRTGVSLAALPALIIPMASSDATPVDPRKQFAQRYAQLSACLDSPYNFRGPDCFDIPHPKEDGVHWSDHGMAEHGARIEMFLARLRGVNVYLGPKIIGFQRTAARTYRWTIDRFGGLPTSGLNPEPMQKPTSPLGFAILPGGDLWATPLNIVSYAWSGDDLITVTDTDDVAAIGAFPWGHLPTASIEPTRFVRCRDRVTGLTLPLMTYHPDPAV